MLLSMLATMVALAAQSAPAPEAEPICRDPRVRHAEGSKTPMRVRPLGEEPLADQEKTVMYREDGCLKPIMVRENVGTEQR